MLQKVIAGAAIAAAVTGLGFAAQSAVASDASGGKFSSNVNALPHLCGDGKDINVIQGATIELLDDTQGLQCNEKSKNSDAHKAPLADLLDAGSLQN